MKTAPVEVVPVFLLYNTGQAFTACQIRNVAESNTREIDGVFGIQSTGILRAISLALLLDVKVCIV